MSSAPEAFFMRLLSPVSRLSFTSASPDTTTASAGTWSPRPSTTTSSRTMSCNATWVRAPSRMTVA